MEQSIFERVCAIEKRINGTLNELSNLIEESFNASSFELSNLPADYCASAEQLDKAWGLINRIICAMKVQAVIEDSALMEQQTPLEASKRKTLQAILEA